MLLGIKRYNKTDESGRDSVHNYYEKLVFEEILKTSTEAKTDGNFLADVACVALNRLPPRYVRYDVDMSFFLSPVELEEITHKVKNAVLEAIEYVSNSDKNRGANTAN